MEDVEAGHQDYLLRQELAGHSKSVRAVCCLTGSGSDATATPTRIISASHDGGILVWKCGEALDGSVPPFEPESQLTHHIGFVYAVEASDDKVGRDDVEAESQLDPPANGIPSFYSGGIDSLIFRVAANGAVLKKFCGHQGAVNSIKEVSERGILVSGGWDGTARVWSINDAACQAVLQGHSHAVCVEAPPNSEMILTGSQDKCIRVWRGNETITSIPDAHDDIVRAIRSLNPRVSVGDPPREVAFASVSNDASLKLWDAEGALVKTLHGHSSFVFDVCQSRRRPHILLTASDDQSVGVWDIRSGRLLQTILHTATVWQVMEMCNESADIVSACEDAQVRVWTTNPALALPEAEREEKLRICKEAHEEAAKRAAVESIDVTNLPDVSTITSVRGTKNGQTKLFADGSMAVAYNWNGAVWVRVGEVVGASPSDKAAGEASGASAGGAAISMKRYYTGDKYFAGGMYDFIFDVEVDETPGAAKKLLPCNFSDNPLLVAEKFCARENIHKGNVEQITSFIRANVKPPGSQTANVGGSGSAPSSTQSGGSGPSSLGGPKPRLASSAQHYLNAIPLAFKNLGDPDGLQRKLLEFDSSIQDPELKMTANERIYLNEAVQRIKHDLWMRQEFRTCELSLAFKKLREWPAECFFPVADLWRILALHESSTINQRKPEEAWAVVHRALTRLREATGVAEGGGKVISGAPLSVCCIRYLANMFEYPSNRWLMLRHRIQVLNGISEVLACPDKRVRLGSVTVLLNYACTLRDEKSAELSEDRMQVLALLAEMLPVEDDAECYFRGLVALGCLLAQDKSMVSHAADMSVLDALPPTNQRWTSAEARIAECAAEIIRQFKR